jgi:type VI secretion system protein ImpJ
MTGSSIYWHDGMFMMQHHMQREEHFRAHELALHNRCNVHHRWGLRSLDIDWDALKNQRLVIRALQARLRDGTMIACPEDCPLPDLDLKTAMAGRDRLTIHLSLPQLQDAQPNASESAVKAGDAAGSALSIPHSALARYLVSQVETADENSGGDFQLIQVRALNARLLTDGQDLAGYETVPILRVEKSQGNDTQMELDRTYIPPLLACDAWRDLSQNVLQDIYHSFGADIESLSGQVLSRGITFDTHNPGDEELLGQLAVLNEAFATLNILAFAEGIHPFPAYIELCRIVGQLAVFSAARRSPELPRYDHDNLGFCFAQVRQQLQAFKPRRAEYVERVFVGEGLRMQVALERSWLEPVWQMFVGIQSALESEKVIRLLTRPGELNMKIGSADRVDTIFEQGRPGLKFTPVDRVPRSLPPSAGLTFFQVNRESRTEEWLNIQKSLTLAIRFNQNRVVVNPQGTIQGQTELTLNTPPATGATSPPKLKLSLFLVPSQA